VTKNFSARLPGVLVNRSRVEIAEILNREVELLQHAMARHGRYDGALADAILAEMGGTTLREKRDSRCEWYGRKYAVDSNESKESQPTETVTHSKEQKP
jgi:hypothetical protein